jgi:hypothetical protein
MSDIIGVAHHCGVVEGLVGAVGELGGSGFMENVVQLCIEDFPREMIRS